MAKLLQAKPGLRAFVVGHTDNKGGLDYNLDLSRRRADAVVQALVQRHRIPANRLMARGLGPLARRSPRTRARTARPATAASSSSRCSGAPPIL